jgi:hypothetical protein
MHSSHACHKRFDTREQAETFIRNHEKAEECKHRAGLTQSNALEELMDQLHIG